MIKLEKTEVLGWEHAIRGMRNPMNSWDKSDSLVCSECGGCTPGDSCERFCNGTFIGPNDHELMMKLAGAGPVHGKFRRMIAVYVDITAPLYWWKEFDTYKVGTVANSCSTMHKIHAKEFTREDFSVEHILDDEKFSLQFINDKTDMIESAGLNISADNVLSLTISCLNLYRDKFLETKKQVKNAADSDEEKRLEALAKKYWWQMIQLLPSSYNQRRTVELNYEVLAGIYQYRKNHKLDEWREFCSWIEKLPYSEIITCSVKESKDEPIIPAKASGPNGYVRTKEEMERDRNAEIESLKKRIQELEGK